VRADVAAARRAGAKVVIVYPHWGTEYDPTPFPGQQALARAVIDAGADMVIGNHAHWVGAMEIYRGHPIWYALGNFVFDQTWAERATARAWTSDGEPLSYGRPCTHQVRDWRSSGADRRSLPGAFVGA